MSDKDFEVLVDDESPATDSRRFERLASKAMEVSDKIFNVGVGGMGAWKGSVQVAEEHLAKHGDVEKAIERLLATHVRITSSTGFLTGLGGLITLPVTLPADFTTLWLTQARLAGAIAHLRAYDVRSDEVRSVVLMSLVGSSAAEALAQAGVQIGTKSAISAIKQVPGRVLIEINKKVGYRLITKAGTKGIVNLTKLAPLVGGVVGGGVNFTSTRAVGNWAKKNFPVTDDSAASAPAASDGTEQNERDSESGVLSS
ncbi:hypothetical protein QFZ35_003910 [Arthrobacter ulcerisalmonis]|nr:hypothetical protein [Arthrobacter ulcerisalmonis]MDQ0665412.1 hypothetical protein [Arthrobacter ulcerisalmonis]